MINEVFTDYSLLFLCDNCAFEMIIYIYACTALYM